jgi:protein O-GlcNAc transferase
LRPRSVSRPAAATNRASSKFCGSTRKWRPPLPNNPAEDLKTHIDKLRERLRARAGEPEALFEIGLLSLREGSVARSLRLLERACRIRPDDERFRTGLALARARAHYEAGYPESALASLAGATGPEADRLRASALTLAGRPVEAISLLESLLRTWPAAHPEARPTSSDHSAYLLNAHYTSAWPSVEHWHEHRRFESMFAEALRGPVPPLSRSAGFRVGYLSAEFCQHTGAHTLLPVLRHHSSPGFEVFCYSNVARPDSRTADFRAVAGDRWRDIHALSDDEAADLIRRDSLDLLVDTSGHMPGNRLLVFARRPAPLQATWLGYPNTTGLDAIDFRFTDIIADPPPVTDSLHSEQLVRLPGGFFCYPEPESLPPLPVPPMRNRGFVTFGSYNNFAKLSDATLDTWAEILRRVDRSRLVLKHFAGSDPAVRARLMGCFEVRGVAAERVHVLPPYLEHSAHLQSLGTIDIALDPFPYNGTGTSLEALWMGVPFVALAGDRHVSRVGMSLLNRVGLQEWIGADRPAYVDIACAWARNPAGLAELRATMRERLRAVPLGNAELFTRGLEASYRDLAGGLLP